jgi:hypothetical protein
VTEPPPSCRHCRGEIIPCTEPIRYCKGWKHAAYLHYGPVGPHYCEGRSVNPLAEPAETCPLVFTPRGPAACPRCTCDEPAGHTVRHHCPSCGVRWALASEAKETDAMWRARRLRGE